MIFLLKNRLLFFVTEDWFFCSHWIPIAKHAKSNGYDVYVVTRVTNHRQIIEDLGFNLIPIKINRSGLNALHEFNILVNLVSIFRNIKPLLVHNIGMKPIIYGTLASMVAGVQSVVNAVVGLGYAFNSTSIRANIIRFFLDRLLKLTLNCTRVTVFVENQSLSSMLSNRYKINQNFIKVIPGAGVDTSVFKHVPEPSNQIIVVMVSRMLWDKGVREFVDASKILQSRAYDVRMVLVGAPDPLNPESIGIQQLKQWHSDGVIEYWGRREDIHHVYSSSNIAVLPSYSEGLPKSLIEAAASSRAIITTNVPGCRDVVVDGENGLLIPTKDALALADAIVKLGSDFGLRQKYALNGRKRAEKLFDQKIVTSRVVGIYHSLLDRNRVSNG